MKLQERQRTQIKFDVNDLNERRMEIFEAKQLAVMRQILLKQFASKKNHPDIDVMELSREELQQQCEKYGYDVTEFINPVPKESVIQNIEKIRSDALR